MIFDLSENTNVQNVNDFYKKLFERIPDLIFQFIVTPDNTYSFPLISKAVEDLFEIPVDDFSNSSKFLIYEKVVLSDRKMFFNTLMNAKRNLVPWEIEFRVKLPIKGKRWLKVTSKPERSDDGRVIFCGRISDITDAKKQELRLRISEERFQFALDASTVGIWDWDMIENRVFYSSLSLKILEQNSSDVFDNPEMWDKIVHPEDLAKYYSDIQEHFENKIPFYENYHRVLTSSGKYKWILDRGKVIERDESGKPLRVIGTHTDISVQKEKELALLKTMELYSDQNSRLINFSHIVTHNLNTQAGNFKLILDLIEMQDDYNSTTEMISHLRTVSDDLNETISHLTKVVDIQNHLNIEIKALNLSFYLRKTITILKSYINENSAVVVNNIPEDVFVNFNPAYLESVLLNFMTNAIKYSKDDANAIVEFDYVPTSEGFSCLKIKDNGLGVDMKRYGDLMFGMYKTFHQNKESRGIGLYITKSQIESMKGKVSVESEVGVGSIFSIFFNEELPSQAN